MASTITDLESKIRQILTAPGTDLKTISAKRVRKSLVELDSSLSADYVKEKKAEIDEVITRVYEEISASQGGDEEGYEEEEEEEERPKRKRKDASDREGGAAPKKKKTKQEQTDAELARQLQNEINGAGRTSRAASSKTKARGTKRGSKKGAKSSAKADEDGEEDGSGEEAKPKKRGGGFKKEYMLSEPLAELLGVDKLSRPQIVKQLWDHIKANGMQNPENKKEIICDDSFKAIFKCDRIDMFKMNKELGQHLYEPQAAS